MRSIMPHPILLFDWNHPSAPICRNRSGSCYWMDEVVVDSAEVVVGAIASVESVVVVDVEELSGGVADAAVDSPSTAGVEVELANGGALTTYVPVDWSAYWPTSRSPLGVS
jgi:hypothetical protein